MATPVSVRLPDDLRERVRQLAADDRRSLGSMVVVLIEEAISHRGAVGDLAVTGSALVHDFPSEGDGVRTPLPDPVPVRPPVLSTKKTYRPDPKGGKP